MSRLSMRRLVLAGAGISLVSGIALVPVAGSASTKPKAPPRSAVISMHFTKAEIQATKRYWTPARMRAAKPMDLLQVRGTPARGAAAAAATGAPGAIAPTGGGRALAPAPGSSGASTVGFSYPAPFTRFAVRPTSLYTRYPWSVNGKVFFTQDGGNFVCSGTAVNTPNGSAVWTAGHCVASASTHTFDSFFEFVPAYNGSATNCCPKGIWVADALATATDWISSGDLRHDLGAAHVPINSSTGKTLVQTVGGAGFAWNQARDQDFTDFGYPQASPFNGTSLVECNAAHAFDDTAIGGNGAAPLAIGCDMTGGSSGGSWQISWGNNLTNTQKLVAGFVNGHNDYKYSTQPLAMYSPYFDNLARAVLCAEGAC